MSFLGRFSLVRAYKDLRLFLGHRRPHEFGFLAIAIGITLFLVYGFVHDPSLAPEYKREITYVQQWPADRTDAQIRAQQAIDEPIKQRQLAEQKAREDAQRAEFQRLDNSMTKWGL